MKKLIVVEGEGLDVNIVRVVKDLGLGQYLTKLEDELNSTFEEEQIEEFGLGLGESGEYVGLGESGEYEGKKMRVFFTGPDDWSIVIEYSDDLLIELNRIEDVEELCEKLGLESF